MVAEKSAGGTADINFKTKITADFAFSINQIFLYTSINKPPVLCVDAFGNNSFANASKAITSSGFETNIKFIFKEDVELFCGLHLYKCKGRLLNRQPVFTFTS